MGFLGAIVTILVIIGIFFLIVYFLYGLGKGAEFVKNKFTKDSSSNKQTQITKFQEEKQNQEKEIEYLTLAKQLAINEDLLDNFNKYEEALSICLENYIADNNEINMDSVVAIICFYIGDIPSTIIKNGRDFETASKEILFLLFDMKIHTNNISVKNACSEAVVEYLFFVSPF